ncbi:unnamed protein product [Musa acuminata subsp. burmannicoides]
MEEGILRMRSSVLFWYLRISLSATHPGRNRCRLMVPLGLGSCFCATYEPKDGENPTIAIEIIKELWDRERERDHRGGQYAMGLAAGGVAEQIASSSDGDGRLLLGVS